MSDTRDPGDVDALERCGKLADAAAAARRLAETAADDADRARRLVRAAELVSQTEGAAAAAPLLADAIEAARTARRADLHALALAETARLDLASRDAVALRRAEHALDEAERLARSCPSTGGDRPAADLPESTAAASDSRAAIMCRVEHYRGLLAARRGVPAACIARLRSAYEWADGDPAQRSRILNSWGLQLEAWGDPDEARRLLERSLEIKLQLEDLPGTAATYGSLAFLHMRLGAFAEARDALARDLDIAERIGARDVLPGLHARIAGALVGMGRIAGAEREALIAIDLAGPSPSVPAARAVGFAWREIARVLHAQGRLDEAVEAARDRSLTAFRTLDDPYGCALANLTLAEIETDRSDAGDRGAADRAAEALDAALPVFGRLGAVHELIESLVLSAGIRIRRGQKKDAVALVRDRILPLVDRLARGAPHLRRAALGLLESADPTAACERIEVLAGMRRSEAAVARSPDAPVRCTVVAAKAADDAARSDLARAAVAEGGVIAWFPPRRAVVVFIDDDATDRAKALQRRLRRVPTAVAAGETTIRSAWPAPPTVEGPAVSAALRALGKPRSPRPGPPKRPGRRKR